VDWLPTIGGIIIALLGGGLAGLLLWRSNKVLNEAEAGRANAEALKAKADAANLITEAALAIVRQQDGRVKILERKSSQQAAELRVLRSAQAVFTNQVEMLTAENIELRAELVVVKTRLKEAMEQNVRVWNGAEILSRQVEGLGEQPAWQGLPLDDD